jgi:hypothetical protein
MLRRFPIESKGRRKKLHEVCFSYSVTCSHIFGRKLFLARSWIFHFLNPVFQFLSWEGDKIQ